MRVIITRPEPDAQGFAALCKKSGLAPVIAPVMEINFHKKKIDLNGVGALAFTSANGVRAFAANNAERNLPVFTVGAATRDIAREVGFSNIDIAGGDVAALSALINQKKNTLSGSVLHIAGSSRAGDLIAALAANGIRARREVLYAARPADVLPIAAHDAIKNQPPADWAVFFSPRTARIFLELTDKAGLSDRLKKIKAACLSMAVATAVSPPSWRSVKIAKEPAAEGIIKLLTGCETGPDA